MPLPPVITVLTGPTASGKTEVSLLLAELLGAEIINADSRQVFRGFDIGTAKPSSKELGRIPHHGIDICGPEDNWTAGDFYREAQVWMHDITERGKKVLVVGGSGLYVRALTDGIFEGPSPDPALRENLLRRLQNEGLAALRTQLQDLDPEIIRSIDQDNPARVLRALEVCLQSGRPYSDIRRERMPTIPYRSVILGLHWDRPLLYRRIDARVSAMMEHGFADEVAALLSAGVSPDCQAMQSVGYKELTAYFSGSFEMDEAVRRIQQHTRNFAKRQMTWFRRETRMQWISAEDDPGILAAKAAAIVREGGQVQETTWKE
ncbi:MAG: tRNA (adenosine(37)-N6)-dimethylallyltransferase MiaA [Bacteroidia bacterium]|nr:tRNA (adenosine(37)-N6)-dimethylallyltransferase MiaA [Bacteroidia bacterium]